MKIGIGFDESSRMAFGGEWGFPCIIPGIDRQLSRGRRENSQGRLRLLRYFSEHHTVIYG
jgi:hypothetical protein